jgi:uncharacterized membrane protein YidH (DUF202 family)
MQKLKAFTILIIILASLIPVYLFNKYLQKIIRPRESVGRLVLYLFCGFALVFGYTFLIVLVVKLIFPRA